MKKPNRKPDFICEHWEFYFDEMLQYNNNIDQWFKIKVEKEQVLWYSKDKCFSGDYINTSVGNKQEEIKQGFIKWLNKKILE